MNPIVKHIAAVLIGLGIITGLFGIRVDYSDRDTVTLVAERQTDFIDQTKAGTGYASQFPQWMQNEVTTMVVPKPGMYTTGMVLLGLMTLAGVFGVRYIYSKPYDLRWVMVSAAILAFISFVVHPTQFNFADFPIEINGNELSWVGGSLIVAGASLGYFGRTKLEEQISDSDTGAEW